MMRNATSMLVAPLALLGACAAPVVPSLAPRSAELIDPRVPIDNPVVARPVSAPLAARLADLVSQAQAGDSAFRNAAASAERLAAAAGARESETWIAAQQALSVAQAARAPTTRALGDIDAIAARQLAAQGGIPPADLAAIEAAASQVAAVERRQAQRIDALQARLRV